MANFAMLHDYRVPECVMVRVERKRRNSCVRKARGSGARTERKCADGRRKKPLRKNESKARKTLGTDAASANTMPRQHRSVTDTRLFTRACEHAQGPCIHTDLLTNGTRPPCLADHVTDWGPIERVHIDGG